MHGFLFESEVIIDRPPRNFKDWCPALEVSYISSNFAFTHINGFRFIIDGERLIHVEYDPFGDIITEAFVCGDTILDSL